MNTFGEIKIVQIKDSQEFWHLINELMDDNSGFWHNRSTILDAFTKGNLYGLRAVETDEMMKNGARKYKLFCLRSWYLFPCFCIKEDDKAIIIWTHTRARKLGLARRLINSLEIKYAGIILPESQGFWDKMKIGLPPKKESNYDLEHKK
jgi:hypothetical protein